jgi:hypothetical protein
MFSELREGRSKVTPAELLAIFAVLLMVVAFVLPEYSRSDTEARSLIRESDVASIVSAYEGLDNPEEARPVEVLDRAGFDLMRIVPQLALSADPVDESPQDDGRIRVPRTVWVYASDLEGLWKDVRSVSDDKY